MRFVKILVLTLIGIPLFVACGKDPGSGGNGSSADSSFPGTINLNDFTKGPVVDVQAFGADATGATDSTSAIQNAINAATTQYSTTQMNFYTAQSQLPVFFARGTYLISSTLDLSFRNDISIIFEPGAKLLWNGAADGTMIELKCSSRVQLINSTLDGNRLAGTFIHHSGNGTSETSATHDALKGKGSVSLNFYQNVYFKNQYPSSTKSMLDTNPYPADSSNPWYYGMDDSTLYFPRFYSGGANGFALGGAQGLVLYSPQFVGVNGIHFIAAGGGYLRLYSPIFSLGKTNYGAIFADNNAYIGDIEIFDGYLESTSNPFVSFASSATAGGIRMLALYGGLYHQNAGATAFIYMPSALQPGAIYIDGARNQGPKQVPLIIDALNSFVSINSTSINELLGSGSTVEADAGFVVKNAAYTAMDSFHSKELSGEVGFSAPTLSASQTYWMQNVDIAVPAYRKLYLNRAVFQIGDTNNSGTLRLKVYCSNGTGATWTSSSYFGDVLPNFLLYDNSAGSSVVFANILVEIYNSDSVTAHTPYNYAGWSVTLDNR